MGGQFARGLKKVLMTEEARTERESRVSEARLQRISLGRTSAASRPSSAAQRLSNAYGYGDRISNAISAGRVSQISTGSRTHRTLCNP